LNLFATARYLARECLACMFEPGLVVTKPDGAASASRYDRAQIAVLLMVLGMLLFSMNDVLGKWLVGLYSPWQLLLIRSLAALVVLLPVMRRQGLVEAVTVKRPQLHMLRTLLATIEVACFYFAVIYLPLADVMAFYLAAPIFVAAMSPFLLGERVGWRRWTAILVGFVGVLIALGPSASTFALPALLSIAGSFFFSLMIVTTRALGSAPDRVLVFWQTIGALVAGLAISPFVWLPPTARDYALLGVLGVVSLGAHVCVNRSLKWAPAATVAPYQYTLIVWALIFGYLVFGDVPTPQMLIGSAIIVASGLFIFWREQSLKRNGASHAHGR
jgi:drug/metabolite transporter (DMT)-like permease